ncbi:MAG TPA: MmcQ/YjbR family DNA-binding protein [Pseudonocardiaceae bacterium]|nr:MmcQ/YjbR family DNA-binding protein [Pseudonocardiaceae bacterium]
MRSGRGVVALGTDDEPLNTLRRLCLALPETTERLSHGEPTWFVRDKKTFVSYSDHHHGEDILGFVCAAAPGVQEALLASQPDGYYYPPYVGHRGWLGVRLDVPVDWAEIGELVVDAYRVIAPNRLVAQLDADPPVITPRTTT